MYLRLKLIFFKVTIILKQVVWPVINSYKYAVQKNSTYNDWLITFLTTNTKKEYQLLLDFILLLIQVKVLLKSSSRYSKSCSVT